MGERFVKHELFDFSWGRRRFFRRFWKVWIGFDVNIGFSVKNDAEWWRYHADSSFQSRERACLYFQCVKSFIIQREDRFYYIKRRQWISFPIDYVGYSTSVLIRAHGGNQGPRTVIVKLLAYAAVYLSWALPKEPCVLQQVMINLCDSWQCFSSNSSQKAGLPLLMSAYVA